ncbi:nucleotide pyrophosphohydrolase [Aurantivibrio plasticivorans]
MLNAVFNDNEKLQLLDNFYAIADAKNWHPNHTPKNLAAALSVEAGELLALFQWSDDKGFDTIVESKNAVAQEMADIAIYLLVLADKAGIDLGVAMLEKSQHNAARFLSSHSEN